MTMTFSLTDIGLFALGGVLGYVSARIVFIVYRAARDTCKWRWMHVLPGFPRWRLVVAYPVLFWYHLCMHAAATWDGRQFVSYPTEPAKEERS